MNKKTVVFLSIICLIACTPSSLELVLQESGENRKELEKVLDHFSAPLGNEDGYKSAVFLIENMPGHYTLAGKTMEDYRDWVDALIPAPPANQKQTLYAAPFKIPDILESLTRKEDIKHLTADFLIRHIEHSLEVWKTRPWLRELSFDDFCEYILPYRLEWEAPELAAKMKDQAMFVREQEKLYYDDTKYDPFEIDRLPSATEQAPIDRKCYINHIVFDGRKFHYNQFECMEAAISELWKYRQAHIPAAFDFTPANPHINNRHCWISVIDYRFIGRSHTSYINEKAARIYRKTFSHNPIPIAEKDEFIPELFQTPFLRNVTALYTPVSNITVRLLKSPETKYAYLSVFNDLTWQPVAYAEIHGGKAVFTEMGRDVVYLPVTYPAGEAKPAASPFVLKQNGEVHFWTPDITHCRKVRLTRKYPTTRLFSVMNRAFYGASLEASNDKQFKKRIRMCTLTNPSSMDFTAIDLPSGQKYRYWRLYNPEQTFYPAELQFFDNTGKPATHQHLLENGQTENPEHAFDNSPLSYGIFRTEIGLDFGEPTEIKQVRYLTRNDANGIYPGNVYELFYYGPDGWISLGMQKPVTNALEYSNVPSNALLWLRNLSDGKEERIFTCMNEEIRFW